MNLYEQKRISFWKNFHYEAEDNAVITSAIAVGKADVH
jgi:hypothetical protein